MPREESGGADARVSFGVKKQSRVNIHILDARQLGHAGIVAATGLETDDGIALFDTGPESTFDHVIVDLGKAGFAAEDVRHVFLSHIHFDHAGAAWRFAELGATVYVHPRGAPHLIDPTKLVESATRIFGEDMQRLWGRIGPVPAERVKVLEDNEVVRVPPFEIRAGDIAGVRIGNGPPIPPFVPPELHVESWRESIAKIRALNAANLYLPHFGKIAGPVSEHLDLVDERVVRWSEWLRERIRAGDDESKLRSTFAELEHADLREGGASQSDIDGYEAADPSYMAVGAAIRYWKKYHPAEIAS